MSFDFRLSRHSSLYDEENIPKTRVQDGDVSETKKKKIFFFTIFFLKNNDEKKIPTIYVFEIFRNPFCVFTIFEKMLGSCFFYFFIFWKNVEKFL